MHFFTIPKLSASKYNEDGNAISLTEMLPSMMKYTVVSTDLNFICIPTTQLEFRQSSKIINTRNSEDNINNNASDGPEIGNVRHNARVCLDLPQWR